MIQLKTNVKCGACVAAITPEMEKLSNIEWSVDLKNPDRILTVEGDASALEVVEALKKAGYQGEPIS
ncbi:heavy-metal-associated domain-containing protein [Mongoliitalea daihaiensis]|uniref:heavy-metal-associated domain-containing protein n=1 Tax=Mongoliitalea daihaiensis TaxID=2782006 RepID=UPI001F23C8B6|nr:cation transporter [Mongoliitalea daihaiensis]UJP66493.1 cation transporter [Mongoliitalea daihaiensis]